MNSHRTFLRIAAVSAFISAVTTFLLWLLPQLYSPPQTFEERILLFRNEIYMARQWVNFWHIPVALTAYFGLAVVLFRRETGKVVFGMVWFVIWGIIEMTGVAIILFSVNYGWRSQYAGASPAQKQVLQTHLEGFYSVWDSMFFVLLVAFLFGTLFFGWATWSSQGMEKRLSYLFWLAVPLTMLILLGGYAGQSWADAMTAAIYPVLQPVSRFVLGVFLWKRSDKPA